MEISVDSGCQMAVWDRSEAGSGAKMGSDGQYSMIRAKNRKKTLFSEIGKRRKSGKTGFFRFFRGGQKGGAKKKAKYL
jgi:hypothetical protein